MDEFELTEFPSPRKRRITLGPARKKRTSTADWSRLGDGFDVCGNTSGRRPGNLLSVDDSSELAPDICELSSDSSDNSPIKPRIPKMEARIEVKATGARICDSLSRKRTRTLSVKKAVTKRKMYPSSFFQKFKNSFDSDSQISPNCDIIDVTSPIKCAENAGKHENPGIPKAKSCFLGNSENLSNSKKAKSRSSEEETTFNHDATRTTSSLRSKLDSEDDDQLSSPELTPAQFVDEYISSYPSTPREGNENGDQLNTSEEAASLIDSNSLSPSTQDKPSRRGSDLLKLADLKTPKKSTDKDDVRFGDSARKKKRFVKGGLAEQLHRLLLRQRSAERFHVHTYDSQKGTSSVRKLVLQILNMTHCYSMAILRGSVIKTNETGLDEKVVVMVNKNRAEQLNLREGGTVVILPPWLKLELSNGETVLLCTLSSAVVSVDQISSQSSQSQSRDV